MANAESGLECVAERAEVTPEDSLNDAEDKNRAGGMDEAKRRRVVCDKLEVKQGGRSWINLRFWQQVRSGCVGGGG